MSTKRLMGRQRLIAWVSLVAIALMPLSAIAQTQIKYHSNKYSVQDDVTLGRRAAQEVEQQFPLMRDSQVENYVEDVGRRLVSAIPCQFQDMGVTYIHDTDNWWYDRGLVVMRCFDYL